MRIGSSPALALGLTLAGLPSTLNAQTVIRLGPVVGINSSTFEGSDVEDAGRRTSFLIGGFLSFGLGRHFAIQPELLYTRKGAETTIEVITGTLALDYIQIPALLQIRFPSREVTPYLLAGPAFAFRVDCTLSVESLGVDFDADCDAADVVLKDTDFSLIGGAGIEVQNFTVSLRYDHGLTSLAEVGDAYNRAFSATFGYAFRLGR